MCKRLFINDIFDILKEFYGPFARSCCGGKPRNDRLSQSTFVYLPDSTVRGKLDFRNNVIFNYLPEIGSKKSSILYMH